MKNETRTMLETPFTSNQIKQRKGLWSRTLDYIEGHAVIHRLNDAFEGDWNFTVVEHTIFDDEVVVLGRLTVKDVTKDQFGSSNITRDSQSGKTLCIGDDLKGAATDALKKCASLLGVGLHLYGDNTVKITSSSNNSSPGNPNSGNGNGNGNNEQLITPKQMKYAFSLARRNNIHDNDVEKLAMELFGTEFHKITKLQASELIQQLAA